MYKLRSWVILMIFWLSACAAGPVKEVPQEFKTGQENYSRVCGTCHGAEAEGSLSVPSLVDSKYLPSNFSDEQIRDTIINGSKSRAMRSQRNRVTDNEIAEIIKFLRYIQQDADVTAESKNARKGTERG